MDPCPWMTFSQETLLSMNVSTLFLNLTHEVAEQCVKDYFRQFQQPRLEDVVSSNFLVLNKMKTFFLPITCALGFVGNVTSTAIFLTKSMRRKSCIAYLTTKCLTDTFFLMALFILWLERMEVPWFHAPFVCQTGVFLTYFCSFLSVWLVVMVTLENYIRICHPKMVPTFCTLKRARGVLLIIVVIGVVCYNFPLWTTFSQEIPRGYLCLTMTEYAEYIKILTYVDTALTLVLPLLLNITWMVGIFRALLLARSRNRRLRQSSSRGQVGRSGVSTPYNHVTAMLLAVTLTFIVLHTPSHTIRLRLLIENFLSEDMHMYLSTVRLQGYFELLYYTNFSTNFLIYVASGKCFRKLWKKHASSCICREISCLRPAQKSLHRSQETNVNSLPLLDKPQTSLSRHLLQSSDDVEQKSEV